MNSVILIGRLTKEADLRYTAGGKAVANFTVAVDKYANGEKAADFINCVVWEKSAEALANNTQKGSRIGVKGAISTRNYENTEGKRVYITEVVADKFNGIEFLDGKKSNDQSNGQQTASQQPKQQNITGMDPFGNNSQIDINDDDLPF